MKKIQCEIFRNLKKALIKKMLNSTKKIMLEPEL